MCVRVCVCVLGVPHRDVKIVLDNEIKNFSEGHGVHSKKVFLFFFLTFYFEINLELKKRLKDSTEISCICFVQLSLMLASYTTVAQPAKPGN